MRQNALFLLRFIHNNFYSEGGVAQFHCDPVSRDRRGAPPRPDDSSGNLDSRDDGRRRRGPPPEGQSSLPAMAAMEGIVCSSCRATQNQTQWRRCAGGAVGRSIQSSGKGRLVCKEVDSAAHRPRLSAARGCKVAAVGCHPRRCAQPSRPRSAASSSAHVVALSPHAFHPSRPPLYAPTLTILSVVRLQHPPAILFLFLCLCG